MERPTAEQQRQALTRRVQRRTECEGKIVLPAVPGLRDDYLARCEQIFAAVGRRLNNAEREQLRRILGEQLQAAFSSSQRSTITVSYSATVANPLRYVVTPQHAKLAETYDGWVTSRPPPYFGVHADAKVLALAQESVDAGRCPVLDVGAGTGRNALVLARRGHPVDAVELTPRFAAILGETATREALPIRVIAQDVFQADTPLRNDYGLIVLSEVVSDFRSVAEWRALLELAARCLSIGGKLLVNAFVTGENYFEDAAAREFAQQVYSFFLTPTELQSATSGLPLTLMSHESVYDLEKSQLPPGAWPPTPWYPEWSSGQDIFDLPRKACPVSLWWLVLQKTAAP